MGPSRHALLGPPVVPFCRFFFGGGFPYTEKGYPYSSLSTRGPILRGASLTGSRWFGHIRAKMIRAVRRLVRGPSLLESRRACSGITHPSCGTCHSPAGSVSHACHEFKSPSPFPGRFRRVLQKEGSLERMELEGSP